MKRIGLIILLQLVFASFGYSQKSKLKEVAATETTAQDSSKSDSVVRGKAAIRGGLNMNAARDSLRGANLEPPVDVVDTFEVIKEYRIGTTRLREEQIVAAEKRLSEIREMLEKANSELETARVEKSASVERISELESKIGQEMVRLEESEARLKSIRADWKAKMESPE